MVAQWWRDASKPLERRCNNAFTDGFNARRANLHNCPSSSGSRRRTALAVSHSVPPLPQSSRRHTEASEASHGRFHWSDAAATPVGRPAATLSAAMPAPADFRSNQIKASLSAFQREEVKVLGFGVKARLRPQRMALRRFHVPFASSAQPARRAVRLCVCCLWVPPGVLVVCSPLLCGVLTVFMLTWFIG